VATRRMAVQWWKTAVRSPSQAGAEVPEADGRSTGARSNQPDESLNSDLSAGGFATGARYVDRMGFSEVDRTNAARQWWVGVGRAQIAKIAP
jgi:hypothetical protein